MRSDVQRDSTETHVSEQTTTTQTHKSSISDVLHIPAWSRCSSDRVELGRLSHYRYPNVCIGIPTYIADKQGCMYILGVLQVAMRHSPDPEPRPIASKGRFVSRRTCATPPHLEVQVWVSIKPRDPSSPTSYPGLGWVWWC